MVTITKQDDKFIFEINGMHKLWALKSQLIIPVEHILNARQDIESVSGWPGWRFPGTNLPYVLTAGTFYKHGNKIFWDVSNIHNCIIVDLKDEDFNELVIEVESPADAIAMLKNPSN
jgi:hypothetical protein